MRKQLFTSVVVLWAGALTCRAEEQPTPTRGIWPTVLRGLDANGDGKLDVSEAIGKVEALARDLDADHDGVISETEARSGAAKVMASVREEGARATEKLSKELRDEARDAGRRIIEGAETRLRSTLRDMNIDDANVPTADAVIARLDRVTNEICQGVSLRVANIGEQLSSCNGRLSDLLDPSRTVSGIAVHYLDQNADAKVTEGEIGNVVSVVFGMIDADADGAVNQRELSAAMDLSVDIALQATEDEVVRRAHHLWQSLCGQ